MFLMCWSLLYSLERAAVPGGTELDLDQRGPGLEAHRRPLVMLELKSSQRHLQAPRNWGNGRKIE